jgi:CheY-like chemotaxis protein/HPt (histidine-containing phosphotransfer) domain-containing protein
MNAIIGMTELVLDTRLSESQREYLGMVRDSADSLLTIINDILDFSKIEAGRMEMDAVAFNLRDTLGDTLRLLAVKARKEELELACHIDAQVPETVIGDPVRLRQVVVNLVGNAIKFTPRGEIVVRVRVDQFLHEPPDRPEVLLNFEVRDTGIGISADKMDRIFRPFEQADTSTTRRYGGTGLGLTICSRLVALMHGTMRVESEEGRGSIFHFTARLGVANPADRPASARIVQGTRALIVDDNATNRLILEEMLGNWGLETTSAADVVHALRLMQEAQREGRPYELVVTDLCMPDRDGFDLVEAIRADPALTSSVILMLTSADRPGDLERCQRLGIAQWLRKPIKQSELFDALVAVLRINAVADATPATEPAPAQPDGAAVLPPLSILLAEDSLVNQKLAMALLSKWGHTVVVAVNGREAVEFSAAQSFDLILMDVQMPELDGLAAARAIREREARTAHDRIPIVAMTAHAMAGDRDRCLESGMDGYVSKPIRAGTLLDELRRVLPARNEARDIPQAAPAEPASEDSSRNVFVPKYPVDWPACERLVSGSAELLREISEAFVLEAGSLLPGLKQAIEDGDARTAQRLAHTLKGSFRTFGVVDATEIAAGCEQAAKAGDLPVVLDRLSALESAARDVTAQLQLFIGTSRGHE